LENDKSKLIFDTKDIHFHNTAFKGKDVYIDIPKSCDKACLNSSIVGINKELLLSNPLSKQVTTPPSKLEVNNFKCVDNHMNSNNNYGIYIIENLMLGQDIITDARLLDYYDRPADTTQFVVSGENDDHKINGSNALVSCPVFRGIRVTGEKINIFSKKNFSITITSKHGSNSNLKILSVELIIQLSPCHPGFHYDNITQTCVYYIDSDIVSCSGSTSYAYINRGYWFGEVDDKATVTVCPNNYCDFTCCKTANGYFKLSPVKEDQCNSRRFGTACGSCKEGYTLSFDSIKCVNLDRCTTGQTVLVVTLSILF